MSNTAKLILWFSLFGVLGLFVAALAVIVAFF